jgi:lipoprotein-anchoring transpeptidase ErfK/SrfK
MRVVLVLIVIAALAGGWYWHKHRAPAMQTGDPVLSGDPAAPGAGVNSQGSMPSLSPAANPPPAAEAPAAAKQALDQAEAMWAAAGADPATSAQAPAMDALYTTVLKALYNQPGQKAREDKLIAERLAPLGKALFFSIARYNEDTTGTFAMHLAASGENPNLIARKYGMSQMFLNRLRGREANDGKLNVGDALKVVKVKDKGGFAIHVDKGDFILDCYVAGLFAKRYQCSVGKNESPTPIGRTHLIGREWHPDWTDPTTHQVMRYGDPGNILGPIWMKFDPGELGQDGIGIHGYTGADSQMGANVSHGCVRLGNQDAEELYNTLSQPELSPTAVEITE